MMNLRFLLCLAGLVSLPAVAQMPTCNFEKVSTVIAVGKDSLTVDEYRKAGSDAQRMIYAIHSSGGLVTTPSLRLDSMGEVTLACAGFTVLVPRYLEAAGRRSVVNPEVMREESRRWLAILNGGLEYYLATFPDHSFYLYGFSLGGYLALELPRHPEVLGICVVSGGLDSTSSLPLRFNYPTLVQRGAQDTVITLHDRVRLEDGLRATQAKVNVTVYEDAGHNLPFETHGVSATDASRFFLNFSKRKGSAH